MKWNDNYLQYSGENKKIIYNHLLFTIRKLLKTHSKNQLTPVYIINFLLNDLNYDISIFGSKEKHNWFISELKNNPYLFDFVVSETQKMCEMPNIFEKVKMEYSETERKKNVCFASTIQEYVLHHKEIPHIFFATLDTEEIKSETQDFVKHNYRKYKYKRNILEFKYERLLKVKKILERDLNLKTKFLPPERNLLLLEAEDQSFDVCVFNWGTFPIISKTQSKDVLFCLIDDVSVRVLGKVKAENILVSTNDEFLFSDNMQCFGGLTAFNNFNETIFEKEVV